MRSVSVLGTTGSIGKQTLDVLRAHKDEFQVSVLTAHSRVDELLDAVREFSPQQVVVQDIEQAKRVRAAFPQIEVSYGVDSLSAVAGAYKGAVVVNAIVGAAGIRPTVSALAAGCDVALANKETLVAAGPIVRRIALQMGGSILPVDSEHSALLQCLQGASLDQVERLILTASGGPFRDWSQQQLEQASVADALNHPTWQMGAKITVDSATLMNKGFEVIEAHELYRVSYDRIDVVIHPQSIVHSFVEFVDGALLAQLGTADMRLPIQYALFGPGKRMPNSFSRLRLTELSELTFTAPDTTRFPALALAYACGRQGGTAPAVMNAANETAVAAFLAHKLRFTDIVDVVQRVVEHTKHSTAEELDVILQADEQARRDAETLIRDRGRSTL